VERLRCLVVNLPADSVSEVHHLLVVLRVVQLLWATLSLQKRCLIDQRARRRPLQRIFGTQGNEVFDDGFATVLQEGPVSQGLVYLDALELLSNVLAGLINPASKPMRT